MSKVDALRAMREARYAQRQARPAPTTPAAAAAQPAAPRRPKSTPVTAEPVASGDEQLCGHKAISGRTCTREQGHSAKSHRYS